MKAWAIRCDRCDDGRSAVVFAETAAQAKAKAIKSETFHACEYTGLRATRAHRWDGRQTNLPTIRELVETAGWGTFCSDCDDFIDGIEDIAWISDNAARCTICAAIRAERRIKETAAGIA